MTRLLFALPAVFWVCAVPALSLSSAVPALSLSSAVPARAAGDFYALYAAGKYDEAIRTGAAAGSADGYAMAARAALAEAMLRQTPCMACLTRAEGFARQAVAADPKRADGHVWLAAALGYESRLTGVMRAKLRGAPEQAKAALDAAIADDPKNPYAVSALGGWNLEIVHGGGAYLARLIYGATEDQAVTLFDRAIRLAPDNVAVHYQIALSLAGFDLDGYRARVVQELGAAIAAPAASAYERRMQERAAELLALLRRNDDGFAALLRRYQGYP